MSIGSATIFAFGGLYERMMGAWSRLAGEIFLDWIAPRPGLRWIDGGCGNGAFTELVVERCAPAEVHGIDPSEGSSSTRGQDLRRTWQSSAKATLWRFTFRTTVLI
jgi:ubiquinone/menaquinone biosynthesis C-methylase UbiE